MDGFMAIVFAAIYGKGVFLSALTIIVYQGFFTLTSSYLAPILGEAGINIHIIASVIKIPSITYSYIMTTFPVFYSDYNFFSTFSNSSNNAGFLGYLCFNSSINDLAVSLPFHFKSCAIFFFIFLYSRLSFA